MSSRTGSPTSRNAGLIHTKGDANATADVWDIRPDQVRGTAVAGIPFAGYAVVYLQHPAGIASVVIRSHRSHPAVGAVLPGR